jgi:type IV pilus assembly protein PilQ
MALVAIAPLGARSDTATLNKIASRVDGRTGVVSIESSDPVPYVASQPDARTFVVELRDVSAARVADQFVPDPRSPISAVAVETGRANDGADVARVRMSLSVPMRPRVRSARNVIFVEADRPERAVTGAEGTSMVGPSSVIRDVRVMRRGQATALTLLGTGRLVASSVEVPKGAPHRLQLDLPNVTSSVPSTTAINEGPVQRVNVGLSPASPVVTRVTIELSREATYRVDASPDGQDLSVVFDEPVADPIAALQSRPQQKGPALEPTTDMRVAAGRVLKNAQSLSQGPAPAPESVQASAPAPVAPAADKPTSSSSLARQAPPAAQAPAPAAGQPAAAGQAPGAPARFTGHAVSLDFQGADLRAVLRTFAEISGLNVVIDPTIQGTVDVALRDVPWDQALDIILRANKLGYSVDGTIVRVAPLMVLAEEESQRQKLSEAQALAGELKVLTRALSYAKAEDLRTLLTATALSQRGSIQTDNRTNTIIINDLPDRLERASDLLTTLDVPQPQVEIEARIVQTTREFAHSLGVQWGLGAKAVNSLGNTLPLAFPNQGSITGRTGAGLQGDAENQAANVVNLGVPAASSALGVALGSINGAVNLDVALSALERQGQGRILSTPRVSTQNNVEAEITQGVQVPIQTVANNTVTVSFKDAALTLKVTPQITAANTVIMQISVENASPDYSRAINNIPPIDTQRAATRVIVSDGDTTVIGGIYVSQQQTAQDRTPGLYRLPLLGWLFKRDTLSDQSRELLIFITPKIVRL